jgi:hypothetical protein
MKMRQTSCAFTPQQKTPTCRMMPLKLGSTPVMVHMSCSSLGSRS